MIPELKDLKKTHIRFELPRAEWERRHRAYADTLTGYRNFPYIVGSFEESFRSANGTFISVNPYLPEKKIFYSQGFSFQTGECKATYGIWIPKEKAHHGLFELRNQIPFVQKISFAQRIKHFLNSKERQR